MKYLLITPSNTFHMPYLKNYTEFFDANNIDYDLIIWDRMGKSEEENSLFIYKDNKKDINRSLIDYLKYAQYVRKILAAKNYDRVVCFSLPLLFVLQIDLINFYRNHFIVDVRDLHPTQYLINLSYMSKHSLGFVLSSKGFLDSLYGIKKYVINHNTRVYQKDFINNQSKVADKDNIKISCIGSLKEYDENIKLINSVENNTKIQLHYNGYGPETEKLKAYAFNKRSSNVLVTGEYKGEEEAALYLKSDLINIFLDPEDKNNRLCLPNRLYNAVEYGKPILTNEGLYFSDYVKKYKLGIVVKSIDDLSNLTTDIHNYFQKLDFQLFDANRKAFIKEIETDNEAYYQLLAGANFQKEVIYSLKE